MSDNVTSELRKLTVQIVSAYADCNTVAVHDLPEVIQRVSNAMNNLAGQRQGVVEQVPPVPAVPIKKSVQRDHITCLECGKTIKMLKRHLNVDHDLSEDEYRQKWS
jgi:predicted transcriptional regulator